MGKHFRVHRRGMSNRRLIATRLAFQLPPPSFVLTSVKTDELKWEEGHQPADFRDPGISAPGEPGEHPSMALSQMDLLSSRLARPSDESDPHRMTSQWAGPLEDFCLSHQVRRETGSLSCRVMRSH